MQRLLASWLEAALHPVLDRYFEDLSREQLRLSIFAGDVVLNGLVLRPEAIRAASLPVHVQRGSVRELRIRVPWLHLQTEPIEIIIDTIEIVVALQHDLSHGAPPPMRPHTATASTADSPAPAHAGGGGDSWVQSLVQRALLNAALRVRNAVVKLVDGRAVASLSLRSFTLDSADGRWDRCFVELEGASRTLRKVLELSDLTLCLDALGAGSSRVKRFERPLLRAPLLALRAEAPGEEGARAARRGGGGGAGGGGPARTATCLLQAASGPSRAVAGPRGRRGPGQQSHAGARLHAPRRYARSHASGPLSVPARRARSEGRRSSGSAGQIGYY
jgi:hypothetical protein